MSGRALKLAFLAVAIVLFGLGAKAHAHLTPNSEVRLTFADGQVLADIIVPQGEYAFATGNPVDNSERARELARRYLSDRIRVRGEGGRNWTVALGRPEFVTIAGPPDLHVRATFTPAAEEPVGRFTMEWRVVIDTLSNHFALVVIDTPGGESKILGAVRAGSETIEVAQADGPLSILKGAIALGARHIATGYDHLLFLLALLLPAPLIARAGQWEERRSLKSTFAMLGKIVTAFTIGHSLTLVGATLGGWRLPSAPVEIVIAVSVLVSALHAIRPIFPGREPFVAGGFGLIHGLAFATLVDDTGAGLASSAVGLFGFNLGIELVQLGVVVAVVPPLVMLSSRSIFPVFRVVGGAISALAASGWIVIRSIDAAPGLSPELTGALALAFLFATVAWFAARIFPSRKRQPILESDHG